MATGALKYTYFTGQIFTLNSAVVKRQNNVLHALRLLFLCNASSEKQLNNHNIQNVERKKQIVISKTVRDKENAKGPRIVSYSICPNVESLTFGLI